MVKSAAFIQILFHGSFKSGFDIAEFGRQLFQIVVEVIYLGIVPETDRIQRIEAVIIKRQGNIAVPGKVSEFIRHAEKAGSGIECETIFFKLVQPASRLTVFFYNFNLITFLCQPESSCQSAKTSTDNEYAFCHNYDSLIFFINSGYNSSLTYVKPGSSLRM